MTATKLKTASVLAFERKLDSSDGLFHTGDWDNRGEANWPAVTIREKSVRGTISNRLKTKAQDPAKLDAAIQNPNLQTVDVATLPPDANTLRVVFTLRVLGGAGIPSACNNSDYQDALQQAIDSYKRETGFAELARRYAVNLANGRFLWRNRMGAEQVEVEVHRMEQGQRADTWKFDALGLPLRDFDVDSNDLTALAEVIEFGLNGDRHVLLEIVAHARMGKGQEVYP